MEVTYSDDVYQYGSTASSAGSLLGGFMAAMAFIYIITMVISIVMMVASWKMYKKAGKPGWSALVPIYNTYTLFDIVYPGNGIKFLFMLVPFYNIYVGIKLYIDLSKAFGLSTAFAIGLIFANPIFMCILGFGSAQYQLNDAAVSINSNANNNQTISREEALARLKANKAARENKKPFEG